MWFSGSVLYSAWMCWTVCFVFACSVLLAISMLLSWTCSFAQMLHFHAHCAIGCVLCAVYVCSLPYAVFCTQSTTACVLGSVPALFISCLYMVFLFLVHDWLFALFLYSASR